MTEETVTPRESQQLSVEEADGLLDLGFHPQHAGRLRDEMPGDWIGRYRLVSLLGEGGFGSVWSAEQVEPIRREVALKLIKRGMDTREVIARFEAESQALAMMDHPNIAAILDAAACPDCLPYFAMELVRGEPLTTYCDSRNLSVEERIGLFIPVCQAVQHAHQKAILHRDLKPSNILVAEIDGRPVPKVIDFGIAKALGTMEKVPLQESVLRTRAGAVIGTLPYMSPEQAGSMPDVDTRSDIYSLGAILYELICGQTPDTFRDSGTYDDALRQIRTGEVPRPSDRLLDETAASSRGGDLVRIRRQLRGDLDWILLKALEKDRRRRYETANALALDLRRYLDRQPVTAVAPTWTYQFSKFARRNGLALAAGGAVMTSLLGATVLSLWQAADAEKARRQADTSRMEAEANYDLARRAVERYLSSVAAEPRLGGEEFRQLRRNLLESAIPYYEEMSKSASRDPALRYDQSWALGRIGSLYRDMGDREKSLAAMRQSVRIAEDLAAEFPENRDYRDSLGLKLNNLSVVLRDMKLRDEAVEIQRRSVAVAERLSEDFPDDEDLRKAAAGVMLSYGQALADSGNTAAAEEVMLRVIEARELAMKHSPGSEDVRADLAAARASLAFMFANAGQTDRSEAQYRMALEIQEALGGSVGSTVGRRGELAFTCHNFGSLLALSGRPEEGLRLLRRAIELYGVTRGGGKPDADSRHWLALAKHTLADVLTRLGRKEEGERAFLESLETRRALAREFPGNADHHQLEARTLEALGDLHRSAEDLAEAAALYGQAVASFERAHATMPERADFRASLSGAQDKHCHACLDAADSHATLSAALRIGEVFPSAWADLERAAEFSALAIRLIPERETGAREEAARQTLNLIERALGAGHPEIASFLSSESFNGLRDDVRFAAMSESAPAAEDRTPSGFTYDYAFDSPGTRIWARVGDTWTETMPTGAVNRFSKVRRLRVNGVSGTELAAVGRNLWIFVPDTDGESPARLMLRTEPARWGVLGEMRDVR